MSNVLHNTTTRLVTSVKNKNQSTDTTPCYSIVVRINILYELYSHYIGIIFTLYNNMCEYTLPCKTSCK